MRISCRSSAVVAANAGWASTAASSAAIASAGDASATWAISSPVAGLSTGKVAPLEASTQRPPTNS